MDLKNNNSFHSQHGQGPGQGPRGVPPPPQTQPQPQPQPQIQPQSQPQPQPQSQPQSQPPPQTQPQPQPQLQPQPQSQSQDSSEPLVKDSAASNSKELLNAYIYDFLLKSGFDSSAAAFFKEANIPIVKNNERLLDKFYVINSTSSLPKSKMTMDTPQGFIYEWWQVFWDIFNARTNRGSSSSASQYYQFVNLKQKHESVSLNNQIPSQQTQPPLNNHQHLAQQQHLSSAPPHQHPPLSSHVPPQGHQGPPPPNYDNNSQQIHSSRNSFSIPASADMAVSTSQKTENSWNQRRQDFSRYGYHSQQQQPPPQQQQQQQQQQLGPYPPQHSSNQRTPQGLHPQQSQQGKPPLSQPSDHQMSPIPQQASIVSLNSSTQLQNSQNQPISQPIQRVTSGRSQLAGANNVNVGNQTNSPNFARPQTGHRHSQQLQHPQSSPHPSQNTLQTPHSPQHTQMYVPYGQPLPPSSQPPPPSTSTSSSQQPFSQQMQYMQQQQNSSANSRRMVANQQGQVVPPTNPQQQSGSGMRNTSQPPPPGQSYPMYPGSQPNQLSQQQQQFLMQQGQNRNSISPMNPQQQQQSRQQQYPQKLSPNKRQRLDNDMVSPSSVNAYPPTSSQSHTPVNLADISQSQSQSQQQFNLPPSQTLQQQQQQQQPSHLQQRPQAQFGPNGFPAGNGVKRPYPSDGVKEYGETLRMLETDNRKKLQDRASMGMQQGQMNFSSNGMVEPNPNITLNKVEPGSQFAEFSNMLGQLQQNVTLSGSNTNGSNNNNNNNNNNGANGNTNGLNHISPANVMSPSVKSPVTIKTTAPSSSAPTPLTNGAVPINNTKKKTRRPRKNSSSVPATPKTPNNPGTPNSNVNNTNGTANSKRGRRKAPSSANTPVIKEDPSKPLSSVVEGTTTDPNDSSVGEDDKVPSDNKKGRKSRSSTKKSSGSNDKITDKESKQQNNQKSGSSLNTATSQQQGQNNGVTSQPPAGQGLETRNSSTTGFNINNDAQFMGEFNGSEQFFDFGLYSTEDASEILPDFWGDPVDRNEL